MENGVSMLAHSFLIESSSKLLVTRTVIKAWTSSISGLWFPWPIYMFLKWDLTLAHWSQVSDRCPLGYLFLGNFIVKMDIVGQYSTNSDIKKNTRKLTEDINLWSFRKTWFIVTHAETASFISDDVIRNRSYDSQMGSDRRHVMKPWDRTESAVKEN